MSNPVVQYLLACIGAGVFAANASLLLVAPAISYPDLVVAGLVGLQAALTWAGIGAAVPQIHSEIGNK